MENDKTEQVQFGVAIGGRTWSSPPASPALPVDKGNAGFWFAVPYVIMFAFFGLLLFFWVQDSLRLNSSMQDSLNHPVQWKEEYGYQSVIFSDDMALKDTKGKATVTDSVGRTSEVEVYVHEEAVILFETPAQLGEKILAVEEGAYPEELYMTYKDENKN